MNAPTQITSESASARHSARTAAWLMLAGSVLSGPASLWFVSATHPQPPWSGAAAFVRHAHPVQTLPFFCGFLLVFGIVAEVTSLAVLARAEHRVRAGLAVALVAAFLALVFLNYVIQTTFVPLLVRQGDAASLALIGAFTMSNPNSLGWCIEMWAYGLAGVATWLVAPVFEGGAAAKAARVAFTLNGPLSVASAFATALVPGWALTTAGFWAFVLWNALIVAMAALVLAALRGARVAARAA